MHRTHTLFLALRCHFFVSALTMLRHEWNGCYSAMYWLNRPFKYSQVPRLQLRIAEVDVHAGPFKQFSMPTHFLAIVVRQAVTYGFGNQIDRGRESCECRFGSCIFHPCW